MQAESVQVDYQTLLSNINDGVYFTDTERRIIYWNEAAVRITGYSAAEVIGHRCSDNVLIHVDADGQSLCLGRCPLAEAIRDRTARRALVYLHHKQGHRLPVHVRVTPLVDASGRLIGGAEFFSDASDQEAMRSRIAELEHLALLDPLTGLPNRNHIEAELASRTTVSMGATMANPEDTGGSLIQRADRLMYASKNNGRNRITIG
jgi:PAS domain S-box-containing protein